MYRILQTCFWVVHVLLLLLLFIYLFSPLEFFPSGLADGLWDVVPYAWSLVSLFFGPFA